MLTTLTRKFCPLMSLAIATMGCGKKATDADTQAARNTENQVPSSTYVIKLDGSQASRKTIKFERGARAMLPDSLRVRAGNSTGKQVEIAYNVNEYDSDDFNFKCTYSPSSSPTIMNLTSCVDYDGDDMGDMTVDEYPIRPGEVVQIRFTGAQSSDLIVEAFYNMKWI